MYLWVHHRDVTDFARFDAIGADIPHAPDGCFNLLYLPARDHRSAVCLWKAADLNVLRDWLDRKTAGLSTNEYNVIDEKHAMGLPKVAAHV